MANAALPIAQQPVINAAPADVRPAPQPGNLETREVREIKNLQAACLAKDGERGILGALASVAALVAGIFAGLAIGGFGGFLAGCMIWTVGTNLLQALQDSLRNREYKQIAEELSAPAFQRHAIQNAENITIDSVRDVYHAFKAARAQPAQV